MRVPILMPQLGQSITEGTILNWLKKSGDAVAADEPLLEVETDKSSFEVPAMVAGTMAEIAVAAGETVDCGTVLAYLDAEGQGEDAAAAEQEVATAPVQSAPGPAPSRASRTTVRRPREASLASRDTTIASPQVRRAYEVRTAPARQAQAFLSPRVRALVAAHDLTAAELAALTGSGRGGRVTAQDVAAHLAGRETAPAPPLPEVPCRVEPVSRARQNIAQIVSRSVREVPQAVSFHDVDCTKLLAARARLLGHFDPDTDGKLTFLPFFLRAFCDAVRESPLINASWTGSEILVYEEVHLGIAVTLEAGSLIVPVIRRVERLAFGDLVRQTNDLIARARSKKLHPDEAAGATATVTNFGGFGAVAATPILLPPQAVMLGIGKIEKRPVARGDGIALAPRVYLSLTFDHRLLDGAYVGRFMSAVGAWIESVEPRALLGE